MSSRAGFVVALVLAIVAFNHGWHGIAAVDCLFAGYWLARATEEG